MTNYPSREEIAALISSGIFDREWYTASFPDVALAGMDPAEHYLFLGRRLGRKPSPNFEGHFDVAAGALATHQLSSKSSVSSVAESVRIRRRIDNWDHEVERGFTEALSRIIAANPGYFERIPVSIVMPTYNRAQSIGRAIASVRQQSFTNWELVIVDDGSADATLDAVAPYLADSRIRLIAAAHSGVSGARNLGLESAQGKYIFYLDSDNTWDPTYLSYMVAFLDICGLSAAYCGIRSINDDGAVQFYRGDHFDWQACLTQNYVDMNCFGHVNPGPTGHRFDSKLPRLVDWDFILRITADLPTAFLPYCGVTYYDGAGGERISRTVARGDALKPLEETVRRKHPESLLPDRQAAVLRPRFHTAQDLRIDMLRGDELSRDLLAREAELIDWSELSNRRHKPDFVSIIVLGYNNVDMSIGCIKSIFEAKTSLDFEIIFVDNASDDQTFELVSRMAEGEPRLTYIRSEINLMFSLGNNYGLNFARGEYTIFLNNDTLVRDGWMDILIGGLQQDPTIGTTGPKLLYPDETLQCGGIVFSGNSKIPYHIYRGFERDAAEVNKVRTFQALTGACLAFRTRDIVTLRGFDPIFINGCEDLDLCFRMRERLGKRAVYLPRSEVVHLESKSKGRGKHIGRNRKLFVGMWKKHVRADDTTYYREDGYRVVRYEKPGAEPHGDEASYVPVLERADTPVQQAGRVINVGFSTMWYPRGISFHTRQLAEALESPSIRTHIFARWESHRFENGDAIYHPRVYNGGDDPSPDMIVEWAKANAIDIMIFMEVHPNDWKRVHALKNAGVKVVCYENLDVMRFEKSAQYELFDYFLFNCFYSRERLLSMFPHKKSLMIPWGAEKSEIRDEFNIGLRDSEGDALVEFVHIGGWGGINNRKNTDILIQAFNRIERPRARLHIYTQTPMSSYGEQIVRICSQNSNIIVHEGTVQDIDVAYRGKSVLLWPSKREGVGLPILESVVRGIPVVISDGYMMKQWIIADEHGWICNGKVLPGECVLPELEVDTVHLTTVIKDLIANPDKIAAARKAIQRDQWVWDWSWQIELFRTELERMAVYPDYTPPEDLSYLPDRALRFERKRRLHEQGGRGI